MLGTVCLILPGVGELASLRTTSYPGKYLPSNKQAAILGSWHFQLTNEQRTFFPYILERRKKKINTFPFSELMSNGLETLPLGAQAIEQSSISSSSSDSSISAATGAGGQAPTTANHKCQRLCPDPFDNSLCRWQTQNYSSGKVKPALVWWGPSADYTDITTRGKCVL